MSTTELDTRAINAPPGNPPPISLGWRELWLKEDWWAIWVGLGLVVVGYLLFINGSSLKWIAVIPGKWSTFGELATHFSDNWIRGVIRMLI